MLLASGFPRDDAEFYAWFQDEAACRAFLAGVRWPTGSSALCAGIVATQHEQTTYRQLVDGPNPQPA